MRRIKAIVALATAIAALGVAGAASAATIGVNEDGTKLDTSLYAGMADAGLKQNILSLTWTAGQGVSSGQQQVIRSAITAAAAKGIKIVLAVYPGVGNASAFGSTGNSNEFVAFTVNALKSFPQIKSIIVGNEPNRTLFMNPVSGGNYAQLLAAAFDAIKEVDSSIQVIGVGLSPRGSGDGSSLFPPHFVKQMGDWYRQSGRTKPLMDAFSFHPYPFPVTKAPDGVSDWPTIGMPDLYRLKQAIWDAFNGTGQPTVEDGLKIDLDEVAYQVPTDGKSGYTGTENVPTVSEDAQAQFYAQLVNMAACDPSIESLNFFHFVDETNRAGFQSGFLDAAKAQRAVYAAVKGAIAATGGGSSCTGTRTAWAHTTEVMGFKADLSGVKASYPRTLSSLEAKLRVEEDAKVTVSLLDGSGRTVATTVRQVPAAPQANADYLARVRLPLQRLAGGTYTLKVVATALLNDKRTSSATSAELVVGTPTDGATGFCATRRDGSYSSAVYPGVFRVICTRGVVSAIFCGGPSRASRIDANGVIGDGCEYPLARNVVLRSSCTDTWALTLQSSQRVGTMRAYAVPRSQPVDPRRAQRVPLMPGGTTKVVAAGVKWLEIVLVTANGEQYRVGPVRNSKRACA